MLPAGGNTGEVQQIQPFALPLFSFLLVRTEANSFHGFVIVNV